MANPKNREKTAAELEVEKFQREDWITCSLSVEFFIHERCKLYNATIKDWVPFHLWDTQALFLGELEEHRQIAVLKARQLGITWLCLGYCLWLMIFRPAATILLFSQRDDDAKELLNRIKGMYFFLPDYMKVRKVERANEHDWELSNGSRAMAFPTSAGRSYTGSFLLVDEADFVKDLSGFLKATKPTVDAGGQLVLVTTIDKKAPLSAFKEIYRSAMVGENSYRTVFYPWTARPDRTQSWYDLVKRDMFSQDGSFDGLYQEYPATVEEALAPLQKDKRYPFAWITNCSELNETALDVDFNLPGLIVYRQPEHGRSYIIGADPAQGNPNSDFSVAVVLDDETWEEVACLAGKIEPGIFAAWIGSLSVYFNMAGVMVERNNHGHAVLLSLGLNDDVYILNGTDDKPGWNTTVKSKLLMSDFTADALKDRFTKIHTPTIAQELATIESTTLSAPAGMHDDHAMAFSLGITGCKWEQKSPKVLPFSTLIVSDLAEYEVGGFMPVWSAYDVYTPDDGLFTRVILLSQVQKDGRIYIFGESVVTGQSLSAQIGDMIDTPGVVIPEYVMLDRQAKEARLSLIDLMLMPRNGYPRFDEAVKMARRELDDLNVLIHPRCVRLLRDMSRYRYVAGKDYANKRNEHGPQALLNLLWDYAKMKGG